jgi:hypothetical protein
MLQALFDWACSWTKVVIASYRQRSLAPASSELKHENGEI